ncbi:MULTISPECIES: xanthine dehydrogenase accessory protein XdhC [Ramlibacter]|uniref:Xanthine dehydrogenase accessory protein XdhC n=1 Tax=Ramlibacter pinisoli TaxID=2682844 RepID=A0A6N8ISP7_9BURK|nr:MULTISPECIES: xanthine dehydrogenase accessory protein XdhC [Ramlibacter]MBA2964893.1 xanthine dehydrogenase accessory protein XdhC [Ramlibacter sp. CGMCC 1.13660]MVQ29858.1 xanthine dehydrogenase accessory protein XdhC [Ramlibacter pinisoli]
MSDWARVLAAGGEAVLVTVEAVQGSGPREAGAWMLVAAHAVAGTIGGGRLEFDAIAAARDLLAGPPAPPQTRRYALGPSLGQCCGGVVHLHYERVAPADAPLLAPRLAIPVHPVALFGGGHVGRAIVRAAADLPFALTWIDSRDEIFPDDVPANVQCEHSDPVHGAVAGLAPGSAVLVMSFSHAEDLDVVAACLQRRRERADLPFVGLIGSRTKWATFRHRLEQRGWQAADLDAVRCPIGVPGITGKQPAVIAASAVAQLLQAFDAGT